jgi:hypothetical protein
MQMYSKSGERIVKIKIWFSQIIVFQHPEMKQKFVTFNFQLSKLPFDLQGQHCHYRRNSKRTTNLKLWFKPKLSLFFFFNFF